MIFSTVIVDDEKLAIDLIADYVDKTTFLTLKATFRDAIEAVNYLNSHKVDLLLLDINMPSLNGIELFDSLQDPPRVIFITAHPDYALQGFQLNALDFLVKPVRYPQFLKAVNKLAIHSRPIAALIPKEGPDNFTTIGQKGSEEGYIFLKVDNRYERVQLASILYIEAYGDYVIYYLKDSKWMSLQSMSRALTGIASKDFVRVHRSYIVNLRHVDTVFKDYLTIGKQDISIGKSYNKDLLTVLNKKQ